jgi:hypothetical protein
MNGDVRITSTLRRAIRESPSTPVVCIRGANASEFARVVADASRDYWDHLPALALDAGITDLEEGDSPRFISEPIAIPGGLIVWADCHDMPPGAVLLWPEAIRRHLIVAGCDGLTLTTPRRNYDVYEWVHACPVVTLNVYAPPDNFVYGEGLPQTFVDVALDWLNTAGAPDQTAWLGIEAAVEIPSTLRHLPELLRAVRKNPSLRMLTGNLETSAHAAQLVTFQMKLAACGPAIDEDSLLARANDLEALARRLAPHAAQVAIDVPHCDFDTTDPRQQRDTAWDSSVEYIADDVLEDAYPFQILGPGHLARAPKLRDLVEDVGADRYLLRLGDYRDWRPDSPRFPEMLAEGRALLASCMVSSDEAFRLRSLRPPR